MTLLITHSACLEHLTPPGHPERPDRLRAIEQVLEHEKFMFLLREQCPRAELEIIALCHPREYIEGIRTAVPQIGLVQLDDDTVLSAGSFEASLRAAGGAILAVDEVMAGKARNAFVAIRPAGHHAEASTAMGFCLFNNAAIAVRHAQRRYGAERAAIVDFDAHHGNGSQQIFWSDRTVMYCSTHEMPLFPGTGSISERGEHNNVVNAPLRAGDSGETFRRSRSRFFRGFRNFDLTSSSSRLVSTHTGSTLWQTSTSRRRISAGRRTGSWRSLTRDQRAGSFQCSKAAMPLIAWLSRSRRTSRR
jgi:acetoin utilization deacetylase AcuC-like enzyme